MFRQVLVGFVAIVVGFVIGCAIGVRVGGKAQARNAAAIDLAALRSNPGKYSGKLVRLTGKLDECYAWECSLCPESMTTANADPKQCFPLEFRSLMSGTGFGEDAKESVFRFSSVTLIATFDPTCLQSPCLDRGTVLRDADVISVPERHASRDGLWLGTVTPLEEAPQPLRETLRAEALNAGFPPEPSMKVFSVKGDAGTAVVCWTAVGTASWPSSLEGALNAKSTTDLYSCNKARKIGNRWIVQVQE